MNPQPYSSVDEALASLTRAVQPAHDLWPRIAAQLGQQANSPAGPESRNSLPAARMQWPLALAASLAVMGLALALCWSVLRERAATELLARSSAPPVTARTLVNFEPTHNADYVAARAELARVFNERLQLLAPATRTRVQADLETIRKAQEDIRAALAKDPASPLLLNLLQNTAQQEIQLYTSVNESTDPILMRRT
jgi:hypothetical protein